MATRMVLYLFSPNQICQSVACHLRHHRQFSLFFSSMWPPNFIATFVMLGPILAGVFACHTFQCSIIMIPIRAYIAQSLWLFVCFPNSNLQRTAFSYLISCELDFESKRLEGPIVLYPESCCSENE